MTLLQLRTLCLDWLDDPQGSYFTQTVMDLRLNLALKELQKRLISANKEWYSQCVFTTTVQGQKAYMLPDDFIEVIRLERKVQNSNEYPNVKINPITPNERDAFLYQSGAPAAYYFEKDKIMLVPTPDAAYEIHLEYEYEAADMVLDADEPDAPIRYHEYLAVLATRDCLIKDGRPLDPIQLKLNDYEKLLKQNAVQRQADQPRMVVSASSGGTWGDY